MTSSRDCLTTEQLFAQLQQAMGYIAPTSIQGKAAIEFCERTAKRTAALAASDASPIDSLSDEEWFDLYKTMSMSVPTDEHAFPYVANAGRAWMARRIKPAAQSGGGGCE